MSERLVAVVLLDVAIILVAAYGAGMLARRLGQPPVIGEIAAGILLGPSLLGALPGDPSALLFPADARPYLAFAGQLGLVLFMFQVGLDLDRRQLRGARTVGMIAGGSVTVPFAVGAVMLAPYLWSRYPPAGVDRVTFALFIGTVLAITAFPVLARILRERDLEGTRLGSLALGAAAVNDLAGWLVLAAVLAAVNVEQDVSPALRLAGTAGFVAVLALFVRPRVLGPLQRRFLRRGELTPGVLAAVLALVLAAAAASGAIGTHVVFGAFLVGVAWPAAGREAFASVVRRRLDPLVRIALLPVFFVLPGFATDLTGIDRGAAAVLAVILVAAIGAKAAGAIAGARAARLGWRDAAALGTLMNTRGLMELVVLNLGLTAGLVQPELYTLLVVMAIVTTVMTDPVLRWLLRRPSASAVRPGRLAGALSSHDTTIGG